MCERSVTVRCVKDVSRLPTGSLRRRTRPIHQQLHREVTLLLSAIACSLVGLGWE